MEPRRTRLTSEVETGKTSKREGAAVCGHLTLHADFGGLAREVKVPRNEHRIESESALTVHGGSDATDARALTDEDALRRHQGGHGLEFCTAQARLHMEIFAVQVIQQAEQAMVAQGTERVGRVDARKPVQCFDEQASVFDQQPIVWVGEVGFGLLKF